MWTNTLTLVITGSRYYTTTGREGLRQAKFLLFQKTSSDVQKVSRSQFNLCFLPSIEKFEICNYITQHIEADWQIIIPIPTN